MGVGVVVVVGGPPVKNARPTRSRSSVMGVVAWFVLVFVTTTSVPTANAWLDVRIPFVKSLVKVAYDTLSWIVPPPPPPEKEERTATTTITTKERISSSSRMMMQQNQQQQQHHREVPHSSSSNNHNRRRPATTTTTNLPPVRFLETTTTTTTAIPPNPARPREQEPKQQHPNDDDDNNNNNNNAVEVWTGLWDRAIALYGKLSEPSLLLLQQQQQLQQKQSKQMIMLQDLTELIVALGQCRPRPAPAGGFVVRWTHNNHKQIPWFQGTLDAMEQQLLQLHQQQPSFLAVVPPPGQKVRHKEEEDIPALLHRAAVLIGEAMNKRPMVDYKYVQDLINAYSKVKERYDQEQEQKKQQQQLEKKTRPKKAAWGHDGVWPSQQWQQKQQEEQDSPPPPLVDEEDHHLLFLQKQLLSKPEPPVPPSKVAQQLEEAILSSILANDDAVNPSVEFVVDYSLSSSETTTPTTTKREPQQNPPPSAPHLTIVGDESHSFLSSVRLNQLFLDAMKDHQNNDNHDNQNNKIPRAIIDSAANKNKDAQP